MDGFAQALSHNALALLALGTSIGHILSRATSAQKWTKNMGLNATTVIGYVMKGVTAAATFEAGQPVVIDIPAETTTLDLTAEGVGKVKVTESGGTVTIQKA